MRSKTSAIRVRNANPVATRINVASHATSSGPWLVSSLFPLNLFEPSIAKRFEAGAEEDRAVAQAVKLGCRLAPPCLRLVKPNRIQRRTYPTTSAHTSMSPMPGVLEKPTRELQSGQYTKMKYR